MVYEGQFIPRSELLNMMALHGEIDKEALRRYQQRRPRGWFARAAPTAAPADERLE